MAEGGKRENQSSETICRPHHAGTASVAVTPDGNFFTVGYEFLGLQNMRSAESGHPVECTITSRQEDRRMTVVEKIGLHPRTARDFLDALVSLKMLEREGGVYE